MAKFIRDTHSPGPDGPGSSVKKQEERAALLKGKGGKRGPPKRCDPYNPKTAKGAPPLPGDHNQLYQVAISQSNSAQVRGSSLGAEVQKHLVRVHKGLL